MGQRSSTGESHPFHAEGEAKHHSVERAGGVRGGALTYGAASPGPPPASWGNSSADGYALPASVATAFGSSEKSDPNCIFTSESGLWEFWVELLPGAFCRVFMGGPRRLNSAYLWRVDVARRHSS